MKNKVRYRIYRRRFLRPNTTVYVGETGRPLGVRFAEHMRTGARACRWTAKAVTPLAVGVRRCRLAIRQIQPGQI